MWKEATSAEYSAYSYADLKRHQLEALAQERGNHGDIKGAVNALRAGQTLLVRKDPSVADQWREKSDVEGRAATKTWQEIAFDLGLRNSTEECVPDGRFKLDFAPIESGGPEGSRGPRPCSSRRQALHGHAHIASLCRSCGQPCP